MRLSSPIFPIVPLLLLLLLLLCALLVRTKLPEQDLRNQGGNNVPPQTIPA